MRKPAAHFLNSHCKRALIFLTRRICILLARASKSRARRYLPDAIAALEVKLSDADIKSLEEPYQPHAVMGLV